MIVNHMELTKEELMDLARPIIEKYTLNPTFKVKALELINEITEGETLLVDRVGSTIRLYMGAHYTDPDKCLVWYEALSSGWIAALFRGGSVDILEIKIIKPVCLDCVIPDLTVPSEIKEEVSEADVDELTHGHWCYDNSPDGPCK